MSGGDSDKCLPFHSNAYAPNECDFPPPLQLLSLLCSFAHQNRYFEKKLLANCYTSHKNEENHFLYLSLLPCESWGARHLSWETEKKGASSGQVLLPGEHRPMLGELC